MRVAKRFLFLVAALLGLYSARAKQVAFQDLGFESANLSNPSGQFNQVSIAQALPGWNGSSDNIPLTEIWPNNYSAGTAVIDVLGPGWNYNQPGIIAGQYTVFLQSGAGPDNGAPAGVSLSQSGTLADNVKSIEFLAWSTIRSPNFSLSFDGNSLAPVLLSTGETSAGQPYNVYAADISPYAGDSGALTFTVPFVTSQGQNGLELDGITFSTTAVAPEPNTLALAVVGGLALVARCWHSRKK